MSTIKPTIGRRVWYWPRRGEALDFNYPDPSQPLDAGIAYVRADDNINISFADQYGKTHSRVNVPLIQEGDERPAQGDFCEWMPYQRQVAARAEAQADAAERPKRTRGG